MGKTHQIWRRGTRWSVSALAGALAALFLFSWGDRPKSTLPRSVEERLVYPELVAFEPLPDPELCWWVPEGVVEASTVSREEALLRRLTTPARTAIDADRPPRRVIEDDKATFSAIAVDPKREEVIVQDENLFQILVYDRMDNTPPQAAMTEPKRWIGGIKTKIEFNCGLYVDPATGDIYSVANDTVDTMVVFSREAQGNVPPTRELQTPHGTYGIAVDEEHQELFLTVQHDNSIVVYRKMASGDEKPLREISGDLTELEDPHGIALDPQRGLLFVANYGNARQRRVPGSGRFEPPSITVYPRDGEGNIPPLAVIEGPNTQLNWPAGVAVHPERGEVFVANDAGDSILVFKVTDKGNVAPTRVLKGPNTNIKNPTGVAVDLVNNELWVSSFGNHSVSVFPIDADGDARPLRTIRAAPRGKMAMGIGNPGAVAYDAKREEILVPN